MSSKRSKKVGRNEPCPCGSRKKYKRCHGLHPGSPSAGTSEATARVALEKKLLEMEAQAIQRQQQQGLGKPIISAELNGIRFVAVGNRVHWSHDWKTFHDFLGHYIPGVFGKEWGDAELKKLLDERHPVCVWYHYYCQVQAQSSGTPGEIHTAPMTGAVAAYLGLAYNLYLLAHNVSLQARLVARLKNPSLFLGACYETYVAAAFIKAGFRLDLEDENDPGRSHCEFVATYGPTGRSFSVEAKARVPGKTNVNVGNQLYAALSKEASHARVVFIDVNVPDEAPEVKKIPWLEDVLRGIRGKEATMTIRGQPAPPAYVFFTNYPYQYRMETVVSQNVVVSEGFKIPDYGPGSTFRGVREARLARERHREMFHLMSSMKTHGQIPSTFDGQIPQFAYGSVPPRLLIGERYAIPDKDGKEVVGKLVEATVAESQKTVWGVYELPDGRQVIATCPLTDDELEAYKRHPDTYFGVLQRQGKRIEPGDALGFFDWLFETYQHSSKEQLISFMQDQRDIDDLRKKDQQELAIIYCERMAESFLAEHTAVDRKKRGPGHPSGGSAPATSRT